MDELMKDLTHEVWIDGHDYWHTPYLAAVCKWESEVETLGNHFRTTDKHRTTTSADKENLLYQVWVMDQTRNDHLQACCSTDEVACVVVKSIKMWCGDLSVSVRKIDLEVKKEEPVDDHFYELHVWYDSSKDSDLVAVCLYEEDAKRLGKEFYAIRCSAVRKVPKKTGIGLFTYKHKPVWVYKVWDDGILIAVSKHPSHAAKISSCYKTTRVVSSTPEEEKPVNTLLQHEVHVDGYVLAHCRFSNVADLLVRERNRRHEGKPDYIPAAVRLITNASHSCLPKVVYLAQKHDTCSGHDRYTPFAAFTTKEDAERLGFVKEVPLYFSIDEFMVDAKKELVKTALAKLTDEEKKALGLENL